MKAFRILSMLLAALTLWSCSGSGSEEIPEPAKPEETPIEPEVSIKDSLKMQLCYDGVFAEYEMEEKTSSGNIIYPLVKKKTYKFTSDGKGIVNTYIFDSTDKGYDEFNEEFSWELEGEKDITMRMKVGTVNTLLLYNLQSTEQGVKFTTGEWLKELEYTNAIKKDDLISYSVENLNAWTSKYYSEGYERMNIWVAPCILTMKTKQGIYRFCTQNSVRGKEFHIGKLYFCTEVNSLILRFYVSNSEEFEQLGSFPNWIPVGELKEGYKISLIDNNKDYVLE